MNYRFSARTFSLLAAGWLASFAAPAQTAPARPQRKPTPAQERQRMANAVSIDDAPAPPAQALPSEASIDARANALTVNMQTNLGLTPQQTAKVRLINRRSVESVETARVRYRANPAKMRSVIQDISAARLSALKDVLLPAQFDKYQRKREEKMGLPNTQGVQGNAAPGLGNE